mmetsp:Transcript_2882/g.8375  ORF Transcript_2882/g.8375 Transcript_2882/m.8375 type:complete len:329 (-) Transcript_2882:1645-2631(-)
MSSSGGTSGCTASTVRQRGSFAHSAMASAALPCELECPGVRNTFASSGSAPVSHIAGGPAGLRAQEVRMRTQSPRSPPPPPFSRISASVSSLASSEATSVPPQSCSFPLDLADGSICDGVSERASSASTSFVKTTTTFFSPRMCVTISEHRLAPFANTASTRRRSRREAEGSTSHGTSSGPISGTEIVAMPSAMSERLFRPANVLGSKASATPSPCGFPACAPTWRTSTSSDVVAPALMSSVRKAADVDKFPMAVAHAKRTSIGAVGEAIRPTTALERDGARPRSALDFPPHASWPRMLAAAAWVSSSWARASPIGGLSTPSKHTSRL